MIVRVQRAQLDENKYNVCIAKSTTSRVYGFSWYLDAVTSHWEVLVLDDYMAVMPLPWKRKFGISYITQPYFTQQLGVFSQVSLNDKLLTLFFKNIPARFFKISLQLPVVPQYLQEKAQLKDNYILTLSKPYEQLFKSFYKGRKHALNKALKNELSIRVISFDALLKVSKDNYSYTEFKANDYINLLGLIEQLRLKKKAQILGVFKGTTLLGGAVFVSHLDRITYLFSAATPLGKKLHAPTLLINAIIKKHANSPFILDFEGSMLPNIASFFKSFGAKKETYFLFKKSRL